MPMPKRKIEANNEILEKLAYYWVWLNENSEPLIMFYDGYFSMVSVDKATKRTNEHSVQQCHQISSIDQPIMSEHVNLLTEE